MLFRKRKLKAAVQHLRDAKRAYDEACTRMDTRDMCKRLADLQDAKHAVLRLELM